MRILIRMLCPLIILLSALGCGSKSTHHKYLEELETWKADRISELKDPYGWPSVVGLFWLRNSIQFFGSGDNNDFILPETAPSSFGRIDVLEDSVVMKAYSSLNIIVDSIKQTTVRMLSDQDEGGPTIASWRSLKWHIIKRQDKYFLRVKDSLSQYRQDLDILPYFETDTSFRFVADFIPAQEGDTTAYDNVLGMTFRTPVAGFLEFSYRGNVHRLTALENDGESYFVIFSDDTSNSETYGGGRYIYPQKVNPQGKTILDFNRAVNPPCVFTPYATCPLPPPENILPFQVTAGEKYLKLF